MPVPLPTGDDILLTPPDAEEVALMARGLASIVAPAAGLTDFQRVLIEAIFPAMTGHAVDLTSYEPMTVEEVAQELARRNLQFRTRAVQLMLINALILRPLPAEVVDRIEAVSRQLGVEEGMVRVAQRFAAGSLGLAAIDFDRNGYTSTWHPEDAHSLHTSKELELAWQESVADPALAELWCGLRDLPTGTLGRGVADMYETRGFVFPGLPGSAPPLLAQHDWVHVLADYATTVEGEIESFAFIARANDDMRGFSLLAMVISLFETGYLRTGARLFEYDIGHLTVTPEMAVRLADAMRRGALCSDKVTRSDSIDYLRLDWFELAERPVQEVRDRFSLPPKSDAAIAAGSVGPDHPDGISEFQRAAGLARREQDATSN